MSIATIYNTVRYLKPVQIYRRIHWPWHPGGLDPIPPRRFRPGAWTPAIARPHSPFRFLNQQREAPGWNDPAIPRLWLYNLHYFENPDRLLARRWIRENPPYGGAGWEPFPLSRRIANWIKFDAAEGPLDSCCADSLARQADCLAASVEYHLLANHLFANAKALVFAGLFFSGPTAARWLAKGLEILDEQIPEQILGDGGHFERSPMYHCAILEDLLDLVNLARSYRPALAARTVHDWEYAAGKMIGWLRRMCHPDGRISFFNDAAFGIAPEPAQLFEYAARLGIRAARVCLGESGYIRLENGDSVVLFDAAPIGPDYQPGHAHADTLSIEVSKGRGRVIVNSGTSTYESGPERLRQRGTAAHSTAIVDNADQSEIWGAFRVARRARPFAVRTDHHAFAEAAHDGYSRLRQRVFHQRMLQLVDGGLVVADSFEGQGSHSLQINFHLHPEAEAAIELDPKLTRRIEPGTYHPEFNLSIPNRRIAGSYQGPIPIAFRTFVRL